MLQVPKQIVLFHALYYTIYLNAFEMYLTKIQFTHFSGVSFFFSKGKHVYALSVLLH